MVRLKVNVIYAAVHKIVNAFGYIYRKIYSNIFYTSLEYLHAFLINFIKLDIEFLAIHRVNNRNVCEI